MNLQPIADKLEAENLGKKGKTLFIHAMPLECKKGILLRSPLQGTDIDHELPGYYKTEFGVIVRAAKHEEATALAEAVMASLKGNDVQIGNMAVKYIRPHHLPVTFPVNDGNLIEALVKFDIAFVI
jgi:hypothetical protein